MSTITTSSARPFWATRMAVVAPTNPLPTTVTRMRVSLQVACWSFRMTASATSDVPTAVGSSRVGFMS